MDSAALEKQPDKWHTGGSRPLLGFTEKTIAPALIVRAQISTLQAPGRVPLRNGGGVNKVLILSLKWPINKSQSVDKYAKHIISQFHKVSVMGP